MRVGTREPTTRVIELRRQKEAGGYLLTAGLDWNPRDARQ